MLFCLMKPFLSQKSIEDIRQHLFTARAEFLKGIRSVIDSRIEELEKRAKGKKLEKVEIKE